MKIAFEIGHNGGGNRRLHAVVQPAELRAAMFHFAGGAERNRTGLYMRRHPKSSDSAGNIEVGPNHPLRPAGEPRKVPMAEHIRQLAALFPGRFALTPSPAADDETYLLQQTLIAVPVSDVAANLLRPCFSIHGFGPGRVFFFEDEPVHQRRYWTLCYFEAGAGSRFQFTMARFDPAADTLFDGDGRDLAAAGLQWAVALVPLVRDSAPVAVGDIARADYDLRQIFGRSHDDGIRATYAQWFDGWDAAVEDLLARHLAESRPFETFFHSIFALDGEGGIHLYQTDGTLPELADTLAADGIAAAGLLDSGGSCALFDAWLGSYLNHGWYFREPRGAVIALQLHSQERVPEARSNSWIVSRPPLGFTPASGGPGDLRE